MPFFSNISRIAYKDSPIFTDAKIIFSLYNDDFSEKFKKGFEKKIIMNGIEESDFGHYSGGNYVNLLKGAIDRSDALIVGSPDVNEEVLEYAKPFRIPAPAQNNGIVATIVVK